MHSWRILLIPFVEQKRLHDRYDFSRPWHGPNNASLAPDMPGVYAFHGEHRPGLTTTNYLAVVGPETVWPGQRKVASSDVKDGLSSTILIVENLGANIHWMEPRDLSFANMSFTINNPAGISSKYLDPAVAMVDCSLHRLRKDLPAQTLRALLTAKGGEDVEEAGGWTLLRDGRDREEAGKRP